MFEINKKIKIFFKKMVNQKEYKLAKKIKQSLKNETICLTKIFRNIKSRT